MSQVLEWPTVRLRGMKGRMCFGDYRVHTSTVRAAKSQHQNLDTIPQTLIDHFRCRTHQTFNRMTRCDTVLWRMQTNIRTLAHIH